MSWPPNAAEKAGDRITRELTYVDASRIHGWGLFARVAIESKSYVGTYLGPKAKKNGSHVLWIEDDDGDWVGRRGMNRLRYLNHRKPPNAEFDGFNLYALRDIEADEEITIDYHWD